MPSDSHRANCKGIDVPIIPGVMPIQNYASFRRMTALCKASVPLSILTALEPIKVRGDGLNARL